MPEIAQPVSWKVKGLKQVRRDLCGGDWATGRPTAMAAYLSHQPPDDVVLSEVIMPRKS